MALGTNSPFRSCKKQDRIEQSSVLFFIPICLIIRIFFLSLHSYEPRIVVLEIKIPPPNFSGGGILEFNYLIYSEFRAAESVKLKSNSAPYKANGVSAPIKGGTPAPIKQSQTAPP